MILARAIKYPIMGSLKFFLESIHLGHDAEGAGLAPSCIINDCWIFALALVQ
jgi:hypothetical protein